MHNFQGLDKGVVNLSSFQEKWTNDYFFVEVKGRLVGLVCGGALAVMEKVNLEQHKSSLTG